MSALVKSVQNRVALLEGLPRDELFIHEIYRSLQGESTFAGLPCVFVRTSVCDLRCSWCDTPHAFKQGERFKMHDVFNRVLAENCPLVEITGGEPLLQEAVLPLMVQFCDAGKTVLIETSGAHDVGIVDPRVHIIMDLKCPDSGESERNLWSNLVKLKPSDEIKFVIASRIDWDWTAAIIQEHHLAERFTCLVSAVFNTVSLHDLAEWILASGLNIRMQLQMHKYIWDPKARGV